MARAERPAHQACRGLGADRATRHLARGVAGAAQRGRQRARQRAGRRRGRGQRRRQPGQRAQRARALRGVAARRQRRQRIHGLAARGAGMLAGCTELQGAPLRSASRRGPASHKQRCGERRGRRARSCQRVQRSSGAAGTGAHLGDVRRPGGRGQAGRQVGQAAQLLRRRESRQLCHRLLRARSGALHRSRTDERRLRLLSCPRRSAAHSSSHPRPPLCAAGKLGEPGLAGMRFGTAGARREPGHCTQARRARLRMRRSLAPVCKRARRRRRRREQRLERGSAGWRALRNRRRHSWRRRRRAARRHRRRALQRGGRPAVADVAERRASPHAHGRCHLCTHPRALACFGAGRVRCCCAGCMRVRRQRPACQGRARRAVCAALMAIRGAARQHAGVRSSACAGRGARRGR